jgi:glycosyltransferase involved in cell wall biosynthesis
MKKSLDFNEIISNSAQRSASPVNFLGDLAQAYRECAPAEADWICSFLDCFSESLKNTEFNPEAPFMWSYLVDINKDIFKANSMIKVFIRSNHIYWNFLFTRGSSVKLFPYLGYNLNDNLLAKADKLDEIAFLVFKYTQPTGAHLTPKTLENIAGGKVLDVYDKAASTIFELIKNFKAVVFNSMQLTDLWSNFDELMLLLEAKEHQITWITIYFHEPIQKILDYIKSSRFKNFLAASTKINISLSFLTDHDRAVVATHFNTKGQLKNIKLHSLANILPFSSNSYNIPTYKNFASDSGEKINNLFLTVGSIQPRKGVNFLKNLAKDCLSQNNSSIFVWLGMPNRYSLEDWSDIPPNLLFLGYFKDDYKWFALHYSTAIIISSESEPYSLVASEAIVSGRPVLYRRGRCGLLDSLTTLESDIKSIRPLSDDMFGTFLNSDELNHFFGSLDQDVFHSVRKHLLSIMHPPLFISRLKTCTRNLKDCSAYDRLSFFKGLNRAKAVYPSIINWQEIFTK